MVKFVALALLCVAAVSAQLPGYAPVGCPPTDTGCLVMLPVVPGSPKWDPLVNKLSAQQKEELFQGNLDQIKSLAFEAYQQLRKLLINLEDKFEVYVKLSNALKGGHNVRFVMVQGEADKVSLLSTELGIQFSSDSLYAPGEKPDPTAHEKALKRTMEASARWNAPDPPALIPFPERVNKFVSAEKIASLASSNRQQISLLNPPAQQQMLGLLDLLEANKNYIRLYAAIKEGHVVDYELINGSRTDLKSSASKFGLEVTDNTISTAGTTEATVDAPQQTGPLDASGFDASPLPNNACNQLSCPSRNPDEAEITIVKSVYVPPN
jgi:hypothetical protein